MGLTCWSMPDEWRPPREVLTGLFVWLAVLLFANIVMVVSGYYTLVLLFGPVAIPLLTWFGHLALYGAVGLMNVISLCIIAPVLFFTLPSEVAHWFEDRVFGGKVVKTKVK